MTSHYTQNDIASCVRDVYLCFVNIDEMWIIWHLYLVHTENLIRIKLRASTLMALSGKFW
jgi:hypothetical protein